MSAASHLLSASGFTSEIDLGGAGYDIILLELLTQQFSRDSAAKETIARWWDRHRHEEESLAAFLHRQGLLKPNAPKLLQQILNGDVQVPDGSDCFLPTMVERVQAILEDQEHDSSESNEHTHEQSSPTPGQTEPAEVDHPGSATPGDWVGRSLQGYQLERILGHGPQATVWEGLETIAGRRVTLKILADAETQKGAKRCQTFLQQAYLSSQIDHAGCLPLLSSGQGEGVVFLVRPLVRPGSLVEYVTQQAHVAPLRAVQLCLHTSRILEVAHEEGVTHGNLKPSNLLLNKRDELKLTDFQPRLRWQESSMTVDTREEDLLGDLRSVGVLLGWLLLDPRLRNELGHPPSGEGSCDFDSTWLFCADFPHDCLELIRELLQPQPRIGSARDLVDALEQLEAHLKSTATMDYRADLQTNCSIGDRATDTPERSEVGVTASWSNQQRSPVTMPWQTSKRSLEIGEQLGKCLLTERVGQGTSGVVYRALHQTLNIPVAVKVFNLPHAKTQLNAYKQFRFEARLLAQLNHPNVVRVWDFEDDTAFPYLVLEYVEGLSLSELIQHSGRLSPARGVDVILQVVDGLSAAHRLGIVHRDLKPANILLTRDGVAKIVDLGLAVLVGDKTRLLGRAETTTTLDQVVGTVAYMPPEQASATGQVDHRSDIYALGATFYHMVTGEIPFKGRSRVEVLVKHAREPLMAPHERVAELDPCLSRVITKMMAKDPRQRYQTYTELYQALLALVEEGRVQASHLSPTKRALHPESPSELSSSRPMNWKSIRNLNSIK